MDSIFNYDIYGSNYLQNFCFVSCLLSLPLSLSHTLVSQLIFSQNLLPSCLNPCDKLPKSVLIKKKKVKIAKFHI